MSSILDPAEANHGLPSLASHIKRHRLTRKPRIAPPFGYEGRVRKAREQPDAEGSPYPLARFQDAEYCVDGVNEEEEEEDENQA